MKKVLENITIQEVETEKYHLYRNILGYTYLHFKTQYSPYNTDVKLDDGIEYIKTFSPELENLSVSKVLIAGLGLGIMPYYLSNNCTTIDVIEIDKDEIDLIINQNYLPKNINIIEGDAKNYPFSSKWDYIVIDIHFFPTDEIQDRNLLIQKYTNYLTPGGTLYIPLAPKGNQLYYN